MRIVFTLVLLGDCSLINLNESLLSKKLIWIVLDKLNGKPLKERPYKRERPYNFSEVLI